MTLIRIQHASFQRTDSKAQQEADVDATFKAGGDFINMTEVGRTENRTVQPLLREAARDHGYQLFLPTGYGEAIAVREALYGVQHVARGTLGAAPGRVAAKGVTRPFVTHITGKYPDRAARWVAVDVPGIGRIVDVVWHTNPHDVDPHMHATNLRINEGAAQLMRRKGKGPRIVFGSADLNVNDEGDGARASTKPLRDAGLISCWDEAGKHPGTLGPRTVDVVFRYRPDARVSLQGVHLLPARHSDHRALMASYEVRPL